MQFIYKDIAYTSSMTYLLFLFHLFLTEQKLKVLPSFQECTKEFFNLSLKLLKKMSMTP